MIRNKQFLRFLLAGLLATTLGCGREPADPSGVEHSESLRGSAGRVEIAFQEGDLILGGLVYDWCWGWDYQALSPGDPVLVDLYYQNRPETPFSRLRPEEVQEVIAVGGEIVREFNVGVIRAKLPRGSLPVFAPHHWALSVARSVPDPQRHDVKVGVGYASSAEASQVKERFEELGGVITSHHDKFRIFSGVIPDSAIPSFRELGDTLHHISLEGVRCLDGEED